MKHLAIVCLAVLGACNTPANATPFTPQNTVVIGTEISRDTLRLVSERLDDLLSAEEVMSELNIVIDSPGGSVLAGMQLMNRMKALQSRGTKLSCYVSGIAASMAFQILTACDKRIVLKKSSLLWHRARVVLPGFMGVVITGPEAASLARDLETIDAYILKEVTNALKQDMSTNDITYHFNHETLHVGEVLCDSAPHFCTAVDSVPGLFAIMTNEKVPSSHSVRNLFDIAKDGIIYIRKQEGTEQ
jgi:ATP-dependent protease ClpP protease subunit